MQKGVIEIELHQAKETPGHSSSIQQTFIDWQHQSTMKAEAQEQS
jgi:hypothetical protein